MKFLLPLTEDKAQADYLWEGMRLLPRRKKLDAAHNPSPTTGESEGEARTDETRPGPD